MLLFSLNKVFYEKIGGVNVAISLYQHNENAYDAAISMLIDTGKAAIIHPTGTGKSFIGFKLCEDNPSKTICWLSPSDYIFKTQLENLKSSSDYEPENIKFFTYAKLMLMDVEEIKTISPDYIVIDEFHRCGAEMWGQGVQNLLSTYPTVPILGLSATNIRYLGNQRDMADELFDGNVASEMTLGEAIVRGVLTPPKYVQSVYSYEQDLKKYEHRVHRSRSKIVRDKGEQYLEALRRAIDKADGLDVIFDKHMSNRTGKYIVFCANKEHMDEMMLHTEWFAKVDNNPHIYSVYTEDPSASKSFKAFKSDNDNAHLKLLYAIDALNEGIHIDDISGVILLRPTISPIIYKQQIGRALAAGKNQTPIIFDIVNNIESLYNIGSIEEEMRVAITYYQYLGDTGNIINEQFDVYDEVKNCKELFEQLDDTLTASWDFMYLEAKKYYEVNHNLNIPKRYKTAGGYSLGSWIQTQRKIRAGEISGNLNVERIEKLDKIGMQWESPFDIAWGRYYAAAKRYVKKFGNFDISSHYVDDEGVALGSWVSNIRTRYRSGATTGFVTKERVKLLNELGMVWDQADFIWARGYATACEYYREHGDLNVPYNAIVNGVKLGSWLQGVRQAYHRTSKRAKLSDAQIQMMNDIGMRWETKKDFIWDQKFAEAEEYYEQHNNLNIPASYVTSSGLKLGDWIANQREAKQNGTLNSARRKKLESIGMVWNAAREISWDTRYEMAKSFFKKNGHLELPGDYIENGIWLNKWLNDQRNIYNGKVKGKTLTKDQIEKLEKIGMDWRSYSDRAFDKNLSKVIKWMNGHPEQSVFSKKQFNKWFNDQRKKYRSGMLSKKQIEKLDAIGFTWEFDDGWNSGYEHAVSYVEENKTAYIPSNYVCSDGFRLGAWWSRQKSIYNKTAKYGKLTPERIKMLENIGLKFGNEYEEELWIENCLLYKEHMLANNCEPLARGRARNGTDLREWIRKQRIEYREGSLSKEKIAMLEEIPVDWLFPMERLWETYYSSAKQYFLTYHNLDVPTTYKDSNGIALGLWIKKIRKEFDTLDTTWANGDKKDRLRQIGMNAS